MGTAYNSTFAGLKLLATFAQESRRERQVSVSDSVSNLLGFYPSLSDSDIQKRSEMKNVLCHGSVITKYGHKGLDLRAGCASSPQEGILSFYCQRYHRARRSRAKNDTC